MARMTKAEKLARAALWATYEAAMDELRASALDLVVTLSAYLRAGYAAGRWESGHALHATENACRRYARALAASEPYHFFTLPEAPSAVNQEPRELLAALRAIRGEDVSVAQRLPTSDGLRRVTVGSVFVGGVAHCVDGELQAMRRYGSPRRAAVAA
jgi:hypothetical protein